MKGSSGGFLKPAKVLCLCRGAGSLWAGLPDLAWGAADTAHPGPG